MRDAQLHNLPKIKDKRKDLRSNLTSAEASLWKCLQKSQLEGRKFRRQHSVGSYILDFYCPAEKLAVELDGAGHFTEDGRIYDEVRDKYLNGLGIRVIRIENKNVFKNISMVLEYIKDNFKKQV